MFNEQTDNKLLRVYKCIISFHVTPQAVEHARYMHDISHVVVDNVQFMLGLGEERDGGDRYTRQDAVIAAFRTFATSRHCHVTLVMHPRKVSILLNGIYILQETWWSYSLYCLFFIFMGITKLS